MNLYEQIKAADRYYDMATCLTIMLRHSSLEMTTGPDGNAVIDDEVIRGALMGVATLLEEGNDILCGIQQELSHNTPDEPEAEAA
jgi:hypothetical protein